MARVVVGALVVSTAVAVADDPLIRAACPQYSDILRHGDHAIPKQVFYTGKTDGHLQNLTYGPRGHWPDDFKYYFFDNVAVDMSMRTLSALLEDEVPGIYNAFKMLRPWSFRADIWRYCILWACGGVYVDSKLALAEPLDEFIWEIGFNPASLNATTTPQLYSCRDELASNSMHRRSRVTCLWQGLLIAERGNAALLKTIRFVVEKIDQRWYPPIELSKMPWLFLTGPGAIALATQADNSNWEDDVKLRCRMTYTMNHGTQRGLNNPHLVGDWHFVDGNQTVYDDNMSHASFIADAGLHETQRTNSYGKLFKAHVVYMDENIPANNTGLWLKERERTWRSRMS